MQIKIAFFLIILPVIIGAKEPFATYGKSMRLTVMPASDGLHHYRTAEGHEIAFGAEVLAKVLPGADLDTVKAAAGALNAEKLSGTLYLFKLEASADPLAVSQTLAERPDVEFAHPNIHSKKRLR